MIYSGNERNILKEEHTSKGDKNIYVKSVEISDFPTHTSVALYIIHIRGKSIKFNANRSNCVGTFDIKRKE